MIKNDFIFQAGAAVFRDDKKFLALVTGGKSWSLPKGHIEKDELPSQTAIRETEEEAQVKAEALALSLNFLFTKNSSDYDLTIYAARYLSGTATYSEHPNTEALWLSMEDAERVEAVNENYLKAVKISYAAIFTDCDGGRRVEPKISDISELSALIDYESLTLLSGEHAKRPIYKLAGSNKTARLLENENKAKTVAELISLADIENFPHTQHIGRWLVTDLVYGQTLNFTDANSPETMMELGKILGKLRNVKLPADMVEQAIEEISHYLRNKLSVSLSSLSKIALLSQNDCNIIDKICEKWISTSVSESNIVITHWDFVPCNVMIDGNGAVSVIDFEGCRLFIDGYDVLKVRQYFVASQEGWEAFEQGYQSCLNISLEFKLFFFCRMLDNRISQPWLDHRWIVDIIKELLRSIIYE